MWGMPTRPSPPTATRASVPRGGCLAIPPIPDQCLCAPGSLWSPSPPVAYLCLGEDASLTVTP
jgi:hypothetical protein